jgi:tetratricopeptide (TPR) repeat protein
MDDYLFAVLVEQKNGQPPSHQLKVDSLAKALSLEKAPAIFKRLLESKVERMLPSKTHCRNFLESYPSMNLWVNHYRSVDKNTLLEALAAAEAEEPKEAAGETAGEGAESEGAAATAAAAPASLSLRQKTLEVACYELCKTDFDTAFARLKRLGDPMAHAADQDVNTADIPFGAAATADSALAYLTPFDTSSDSASAADELFPITSEALYALQYQLIGFERHLRCNLEGAIKAYRVALHFAPNSIDARLQLANVYVEKGDLEQCSAVYASILTFLDTLDATPVVAVMRAWTLLHRVTIFVTR